MVVGMPQIVPGMHSTQPLRRPTVMALCLAAAPRQISLRFEKSSTKSFPLRGFASLQ
jgi:hypothetical protein